MIRSFLALTNFDPGIRTQGILHAEVHFPAHQYTSAKESKRFLRPGFASRLHSSPGVTHAAVSIGFPLMGGPASRDVTIPGKPHDKLWFTDFDAVNEAYFSAVGLQLLGGRLLSAGDVSGARRVAVVNSTLVKSFFADEDPIGTSDQVQCSRRNPGSSPHDAFFENHWHCQ